MTSPVTPDWVRDAVFYQIFPDRFAHSERLSKPSNLEPWDSAPTVHGFKGGDLLGVVEHLDYLQDLGITAIYFNPVFQSAANHRYHTYDYYQVDPILGGNEALRQLLDQAHGRGMRVVLDGVFNHTGRGFFEFHHIVENGPASPYIDWFIVKQFPLRPYHVPKNEHGYEAWWDLPALPKLNTDNKAVRAFLWDVACHWIDYGIDGWRLDVPAEIDDDEFWQEFRDRVKAINPEAYIVGEIWDDASRWLKGDQFDAVMNYLFTRACLGFFVGDNLLQAEIAGTAYHQIDPLDAEEFAEEIDRLLDLYPRAITEVQYNLLGSHDTARFKTLARGDNSAYRLATMFQMTYPGAPSIYYGDEIGMEGHHDPDCRRPFPWDENRWDREMRDYVQKCISLRRSRPELRAGSFDWLFVGQGIVAYLRKGDQGSVVVALNNTRQPVTIDLPVVNRLQEGTPFRDIWEGKTFYVTRGQLPGIRLPARSGVALASTAVP
jgi:cyclomaltodextrinase / maltogenic alpha-amylase / neopullulanase